MNYFEINLAQQLYQRLKLLPMLMNGQVRVGAVEEQLRMGAEDNVKYGEV